MLCGGIVLSAVALIVFGAMKNHRLELYSRDSKYVTTSFGEKQEEPLYDVIPTYRSKATNDITYVRIEDFVKTACADMLLSAEKVGDGSFNILNSEHVCVMNIDAKKNNVTYYRRDRLGPGDGKQNNGVAGDPILLNEVLTESEYSHYVGSFQNEIIDLNDYDLSFILQDRECYAPIEVLSAIFYKGLSVGKNYNGIDIYPSTAIDNPDSGSYKSLYANTDRFRVDEKHEAVMAAPAAGEAYRFTYSDTAEDGTTYYTICLKSDGSGGLYVSNDESEPGEIKTEKDKFFFHFESTTQKKADVTCQYKRHESEEGIFIDPYYDFGNEEENALFNNEEDLFKVPKTESHYGTGVRSKEMAQLNLDLLAFLFEKSHGLTKDHFPNGFYREIDDRQLREGLLETDSLKYDDALLTLTMGVVDDIHTAYLARSIYSGCIQEDMAELRKAYTGERRTTVFDFEEQYKELRTQVMTQMDPKYEDTALQQGLFMEGSTAVIRFDSFTLSKVFYAGAEPAKEGDISEKIVADTADGVELAFKEIAKHHNIKNVVFDLTCNTGGALYLVPYLLGYMTDDPEMMLYSSVRQIGTDLHYKADTNRDGVFDENDVLSDQYHFFFLTSEASFSSGNSLPAFAQYKGIPIIGHKSSGGACQIATFFDACGSRFYSSYEMMLGTFDDKGEFTNCDGGVVPDYDLDPGSWYDLTKLDQFLASLGDD